MPGVAPCQLAAVTALGVSVVHSVLVWAVRRQQRRVRAEAVHEIREMLTDEVKNQLADVSRSVDAVGERMDGLTEEKLTAWKWTYANAAQHYAAT